MFKNGIIKNTQFKIRHKKRKNKQKIINRNNWKNDRFQSNHLNNFIKYKKSKNINVKDKSSYQIKLLNTTIHYLQDTHFKYKGHRCFKSKWTEKDVSCKHQRVLILISDKASMRAKNIVSDEEKH